MSYEIISKPYINKIRYCVRNRRGIYLTAYEKRFIHSKAELLKFKKGEIVLTVAEKDLIDEIYIKVKK